MKLLRTLNLFTVALFLSFTTFAQQEWILSNSVIDSKSPSFAVDPNGDYTLVQSVGTTTGDIRIESSAPNNVSWTTGTMAGFGSYPIASTPTKLVSFYYNSTLYAAYSSTAASIRFCSWDGTSVTNDALPAISNVNITSFDIAINQASNEIYLVVTNAANNAAMLFNYDGSTWINVLSNYQPGNFNFSSPQIHFVGDTLYLAGISAQTPNNKMLVFKEHYSNFSSSQIQVTSPTLIENVDRFDMDAEAGQLPYFIGNSTSNTDVIVSRAQTNGNINLLSSFNDAVGGTLPTIDDVKIVSNGGNPSILYTTNDGNGSGDVKVMEYDGTAFVPVGVNASIHSFTTGEYIYNLSLNQVASGRLFAGFDMGDMTSGYLYMSNSLPVTVSPYSSLDDTLCEYAYNSVLFSNLEFNDADGDSVIINDIISSNTAVLPSGIASYTINSFALNHYEILASPNAEGDSVILDIAFTDGYVNDTLSIIYMTVVAPAPINIPATDAYICDNASEVNLNVYSAGYPGVWTAYLPGGYDTIQGGILDLSTIPGIEMISSLDFHYTDPTYGCVLDYTFVPISAGAPSGTITTTNADCGQFNGTALLDTTTGSAPISSITWSTGDIDSLSITQLLPGQYMATISDTNDCIYTAVANVGVNGLTVNETITNVTCFGGNNGAITITVSGPGAPYTYLWSNGKSTASISNLVAGTYNVTITSATGCQSVETYTVSQAEKIEMSYYYTDDATCGGGMDGNINVDTIMGGVLPYTYLWSNGQNAQDNLGVGAGAYTLTVTDFSGCTASFNAFVAEAGAPSAYLMSMIPASCNQSNGSITLDIYGGDPIQDISWSNGDNGSTINNLAADTYTCTITTTTGCSMSKEFEVETEQPLQNNICLITVDSATTTNLLVWEKVETNMDHYNIYRETSVAGEFMLIDTVSGLNTSEFNDVVASPKVRSWRYKISAVNQCGVEGPKSAPHRTSHLVISQITGNQYNIAWNAYEGFDYTTADLWRYTNANGWELIQTLPKTTLSFTDNLSVSATGLDYMLEITPPSTCTSNKAQNYNSSRSNKANGLMVPGNGTGVSNNGIAEYEGDLALTMFPNPTTGELNLIWEGENTSYTITDMQGKLIQDGKLSQGKSIVDLSAVETGMYFIQINGKTKKIIVR